MLIYDKVCQEIIAPLLNIGTLRMGGVTLNLLLDSNRDAVPEVTAVYFVAPTQDNIGRILMDLQNGLYDQIHVNFCSSIEPDMLKMFAEGAAKSNSVSKIFKVPYITHY